MRKKLSYLLTAVMFFNALTFGVPSTCQAGLFQDLLGFLGIPMAPAQSYSPTVQSYSSTNNAAPLLDIAEFTVRIAGDSAEELIESAQDAALKIIEIAPEVEEYLEEGVRTMIHIPIEILDYASEHTVEAVLNILNEAIDIIDASIPIAITFVQDMAQLSQEVVSNLVDMAMEAAKVFKPIIVFIGDIAEEVVRSFITVAERVMERIAPIIIDLRNVIRELAQIGPQILAAIARTANSTVVELIDATRMTVSSFANIIPSFFSNFFNIRGRW